MERENEKEVNDGKFLYGGFLFFPNAKVVDASNEEDGPKNLSLWHNATDRKTFINLPTLRPSYEPVSYPPGRMSSYASRLQIKKEKFARYLLKSLMKFQTHNIT